MRWLAAALLLLVAAPVFAQAGDAETYRREAEASRRALERALLEMETIRDELVRTRAEIDRLRAADRARIDVEAAAAAAAVAAPITSARPLDRRTHVVQRGDTLGSISARYYGTPGQYTRIFEANRDQVSNPNRIEPGQVLVIP